MIHAMIEFEEDEPAMKAVIAQLNDELNRVTQRHVTVWFTSRHPEVVSVHDMRDPDTEHSDRVRNYERINIQRLIEELRCEPAGSGADGVMRAAQRINLPPPARTGRRKKVAATIPAAEDDLLGYVSLGCDLDEVACRRLAVRVLKHQSKEGGGS